MPNIPEGSTNNLQSIPEIDVVFQAGKWPDEIDMLELATISLSIAVEVAELKFLHHAEISVVLSDDEHVQKLNKTWREINKPTNVLSFPVENIEIGEMPGALLGDIVLSIDTIAKEAIDQDILLNDHLSHLVIHGFLHIFGYDHMDDNEAEEMEAIETACLGRLGIANPHTVNIA